MFSKISHISIIKHEPLSKHCTFKIGGDAKFFIRVHNINALLDTLYICNQHHINHKIIGNGSNMLFDDLGYSGAIIKYDDNFKQIKNNKLYACSGCDIAELIQYTTQNNLGGLEFAIGIPANLGGAITNNLGAYNQQISTYIEHITVLRNNHIIYLTPKDCDFKYHSSTFKQNNDIILSAIFDLPYQDKFQSIKNAKQFLDNRNNSQPLQYPNAGSIFRREQDVIPAKLIDQAGLKGLTVNDAQLSTKHAGFIINKGYAKCKDVLNLIEIIKNKILEKYNINLHTEIEYLPFK